MMPAYALWYCFSADSIGSIGSVGGLKVRLKYSIRPRPARRSSGAMSQLPRLFL